MNFTPKNAEEYYCKNCDFKCFKRSDWDRHKTTSKHKNRTKLNNLERDFTPSYICNICNKTYNARNSLWYHKKKCTQNNDLTINNEENFSISKDQLIKYLMKENNEFKDMLLEQNKMVMKICENEKSVVNNINSNNKTFNLQLFLNETCKDAMNIMDFVDSIKLQLSDLEKVGELGYVEGISNIIVKNLKELDVTQRPVHCTDKKREILYIKDEDKWEKEDNQKKKMHKVIKRVADKNARLLPKFKEAHPDCIKSSSPFSDQYNKIIVESMGGPGNNDYEKEEKIIKNISKQIVIEK